MASFSSHVRRESVGMPMTSGGESNTKGTAYETELVALQLIRLLLGKVDSVTWHHGQAGDGIDLVVYEDGIEWGIQAKSGTSKETWTLPRLMEKGVPAYAQLWLKGASNRRFRFQAAVTAPILKKLTITANTMSENEWWKSIDEGSLHPWIKAFAGVMDRSSGHALFKRIDVGFAQIEECASDLYMEL